MTAFENLVLPNESFGRTVSEAWEAKELSFVDAPVRSNAWAATGRASADRTTAPETTTAAATRIRMNPPRELERPAEVSLRSGLLISASYELRSKTVKILCAISG